MTLCDRGGNLKDWNIELSIIRDSSSCPDEISRTVTPGGTLVWRLAEPAQGQRSFLAERIPLKASYSLANAWSRRWRRRTTAGRLLV